AEVVDRRRVGATQSQPRFLNGVVDVTERAEQPVSHGTQMGSVIFELLGQVIGFAHRSHFLVALRQSNDGRTVSNVTQRGVRTLVAVAARWQQPKAPEGIRQRQALCSSRTRD